MNNVENAGRIEFPPFTGVRCSMMPFVQGDPDSLPDEYASYADVVDKHFVDRGTVGYLTVHESVVPAGASQRGYGAGPRTVHVEVQKFKQGYFWGGGGWGDGSGRVKLRGDVGVLIANSVDDTCRVWDAWEDRPTKGGDLSPYLDDYPPETGRLLKAGEAVRIGVLTPHECVPQRVAVRRQFLRIVSWGVLGREEHFTVNPKVRGNG